MDAPQETAVVLPTPPQPHQVIEPEVIEPEKELTFKQRKWLAIYLETGNATEAAMQVYDCKDRGSASVIGHENLVKLSYVDILEEAGITDKILLDKLKDGLDASRVISIQVNGETKQIKLTDYLTRHKYLETGLKLKKRLVERQEIEETKTFNLNVNVLLDKVYGQPSIESDSTT